MDMKTSSGLAECQISWFHPTSGTVLCQTLAAGEVVVVSLSFLVSYLSPTLFPEEDLAVADQYLEAETMTVKAEGCHQRAAAPARALQEAAAGPLLPGAGHHDLMTWLPGLPSPRPRPEQQAAAAAGQRAAGGGGRVHAQPGVGAAAAVRQGEAGQGGPRLPLHRHLPPRHHRRQQAQVHQPRLQGVQRKGREREGGNSSTLVLTAPISPNGSCLGGR